MGVQGHSGIPALACLHVLVSCSMDDAAMVEFPDSEVVRSIQRVAQSQGYSRMQFSERASFLQSIEIHKLAERNAPPAVLQLFGQRGNLRCSASVRANREGSARTILGFLGAIRSASKENTYSAQRAFLAAGLGRLLVAPYASRRD